MRLDLISDDHRCSGFARQIFGFFGLLIVSAHLSHVVTKRADDLFNKNFTAKFSAEGADLCSTRASVST